MTPLELLKEHPAPWKLGDGINDDLILNGNYNDDSDADGIVVMEYSRSYCEREEALALVALVNSYAAMVEAAKGAINTIEDLIRNENASAYVSQASEDAAVESATHGLRAALAGAGWEG
jgi:hypothetical protein